MAKHLRMKRMSSGADPSILDGLNEPQREAASTVDGPLLILAGAGSGKTRVITHRIAHMVRNCEIGPEQILAVTFTNKAAQEMRERVDDLLGPEHEDAAWRITISTFHSLCARLLRKYAPRIGLTRHFVIYDDADQRALVKQVMIARDLKPDRSEINRLRDMMERHKNAGRTATQAYEHAHSAGAEDDAAFYEAYQHALRTANCVDFGDLILGVLELLRADADLARLLSEQWRYLMVDEFQDTNPSQYELLRHLSCAHDNVCVVGDDDQSIYRWRGATIANIMGFDRDFDETRIVKLEQNYRSTQVILDAANDIISRNQGRRPKVLWTERSGGDPITCFAATDDREEATWVARTIASVAHEGVGYGDVAVFYRTNAQARAFEEQLRFAGIGYQVVGGMSFYAREEIKDLLSYLRVALNPASEVDLLRVLNTPKRGVGNTTIDKLRIAAAFPEVGSLWDAVQWAAGARLDAQPMTPEVAAITQLGRPAAGIRSFHEIVSQVRASLQEGHSLAAILQQLLLTLDYRDHLQNKDSERADDKMRNAHELVNAIDDFETQNGELGAPVDVLRAFLDRSALLASIDGVDPDAGRVTLMTVHSSKGLEFDTVFLAGMEDKTFPSLRDDDEEELEEERRLAYVAITRAKRKLYVSYAHRRRVFGEWRNMSQSRFLAALDPQRLELDPGSASPSMSWGARQRRDAHRTFRRSNLGRDRDAWEFDQTAPMIRASTRAKPTTSDGEDTFQQDAPSYEFFDDDPSVLPPAATAPAEPDSASLVGRFCSHTRFGTGEILAVSGHGDMATVTVSFASDGTKKIKRRFLKIY